MLRSGRSPRLEAWVRRGSSFETAFGLPRMRPIYRTGRCLLASFCLRLSLEMTA